MPVIYFVTLPEIRYCHEYVTRLHASTHIHSLH